MAKPLNVLMLTGEYPPYSERGMATHVEDLVQGITSQGHSAYVLSHAKDIDRVLQKRLVRIVFVSAGRANPNNSSAFLAALNRRLSEVMLTYTAPSPRIHIIHCHDCCLFPTAVVLRESFGVPIISTPHILWKSYLRAIAETGDSNVLRLEECMCSMSDELIAVSHFMQRDLKEQYSVTPSRISVIHNGIRSRIPSAPLQSPLRIDARLPDSARFVLFVGAIIPQKGIIPLLRSAIRVVSTFADVYYLLAGDSQQTEYCELVHGLVAGHPGLQNRVFLIGRQDPQLLADLYTKAALVVVPSLYESFGYAALEAMRAGAPVIATSVGGMPEIIQDSVSGVFIHTLTREDGGVDIDIEELSTAQIAILSDARFASHLGKNASVVAADAFSHDRMVGSTLSLYSRVVGTHS